MRWRIRSTRREGETAGGEQGVGSVVVAGDRGAVAEQEGGGETEGMEQEGERRGSWWDGVRWRSTRTKGKLGRVEQEA